MNNQDNHTKPILVTIENTLKTSYLDYAMSVIVGRALPDIRDGLKPVHRRVLFAMHQMGMQHNKPYLKSARVVGDVIGKYHPHGDTAIYDTLVRMAQPFSLRYMLVDGQGNFGSIDGDSAAAMRYTEARMQKITQELLVDLDKNTVDFSPNYDGSLYEPTVFPTKIPTLLINGTSGIAVGMATNIAPHNLTEIMNALIAKVDNPEIEDDDIFNIITGPDFPTQGIIMGRSQIRQAYKTGRGSIKMRAKAHFEDLKGGREQIVVTEIPYMVNKATLIEKIAELVNDKRINGVSDLRDESDANIRVVVELKRGEVADVVLNQLYKYTQMESTFGMNMVVLINGNPKLVGIIEVLDAFIEHRIDIVTRRTLYLLKKAEDRLHIIEGLKIAVENIDEVVAIIKQSADTNDAKINLINRFSLSEVQAQAILEMRLSRLTGLEIEKLDTEYKQLLIDINGYKLILSDKPTLMAIIKEEMIEIRNTYGDDRKTEIMEDTGDLDMIDLIPDDEMLVTITHNGYIKRTPLSEFTAQRRGGKGKSGASSREDDFIESLLVTTNHSQLLFFTNSGKVHFLNVYNLPEMQRATRGRHISNFISLEGEEDIASILAVALDVEQSDTFIFFGTRKGQIKKIAISEFRSGRNGIIAIKLDDGDELITSLLTTDEDRIFMASKEAKSIQFAVKEVIPRRRPAGGLRGMRLSVSDEVVSMEVTTTKGYIMSVTEKGYGKRTLVTEYREQARGGAGLRLCRINKRTGMVVGARQVTDADDVMLITKNGRTIRLEAGAITVLGRDTQGVKLMDTDGDEIMSVGIVRDDEESNEII